MTTKLRRDSSIVGSSSVTETRPAPHAKGRTARARDAARAGDVAKTAPEGLGKRENSKAQNRDAILAAARVVFSDLGYEAASVRDIIRRTGLASGTFYNYFRSKEEVARALASSAAERLRPILSEQREAAPDFESYLDGIVRAYFHFLVDEEQLWPLAQPPRSRRYPKVRVETPEQGAIYDEIKASIARAIERGLAPPVDAGYLSASIIGIARSVGDKLMQRRPPEPDKAADFVVTLILQGLAAVPASRLERAAR